MLILVPIVLGWLAVAALCAALCRVAAAGEDALVLDSQIEIRPALEQLAIWEGLSQPTIRDTRGGTSATADEREPVALASHP